MAFFSRVFYSIWTHFLPAFRQVGGGGAESAELALTAHNIFNSKPNVPWGISRVKPTWMINHLPLV